MTTNEKCVNAGVIGSMLVFATSEAAGLARPYWTALAAGFAVYALAHFFAWIGEIK